MAGAVTEFWEPWHPEVGQRVRIRLNGECDIPTWWVKGEKVVDFGNGHLDIENNCVGTIIECPFTERDGYCRHVEVGHPYAVVIDGGISQSGVRIRGAHYAALELEPVDW